MSGYYTDILIIDDLPNISAKIIHDDSNINDKTISYEISHVDYLLRFDHESLDSSYKIYVNGEYHNVKLQTCIDNVVNHDGRFSITLKFVKETGTF